MSTVRRAIIIGAGPAGLTAAFELLQRTDVVPIVLEASAQIGGLAQTVNHKGNRIDIGGHRFFSKSDRVMDWWLGMMPLAADVEGPQAITYRRQSRALNAAQGADADAECVMLLRPRKSRIYFMRRFFDYPISLSADTIRKLGLWKTIKIGLSYARAAMLPIRNEHTLEQFFINRFGRELYNTFFRSYTEKVWGVPCEKISASWGAQRVKGLSITKAIAHFVKKLFSRGGDLAQKGTETSLIEQFLYPKFGPGQMWETTAARVRERGGAIHMQNAVTGLEHDGQRVLAVTARNEATGQVQRFEGHLFFSTMPIRDLVRGLTPAAPVEVRSISDGLVYRDFITVGLLLDELKIRDDSEPGRTLIRDNWIYIQEPDVLVGRLQIFNNWSPFMVADPGKVWVGLEYFCNDTDALWRLPDGEMIDVAKRELEQIGIIESRRVQDACVIRMPKTYPAYFGTYDQFDVIRRFVDQLENLYLIGRNGMHRYNNQDHSMLTAMTAVDNIVAGRTDKANVWEVNTEEDYHEEKK